jgi:hypothetical protein
VEYNEEGVPRCRVKMTIRQHPSRSLWQPIEIDVVDHHLADTFEAAALEAINIFCDQHPDCGRTNLNYTGSSTRVLSGGLPRASNGIILLACRVTSR